MNKKDIKIGMYTPFFLPVLGGAEIATYNISKKLKEYCDVKIYTYNWVYTADDKKIYGINLSSKLPRKQIINGVKTFRYPIINLPFVKNFSINMIDDLIISDIDIMHFQGLSRLFNRILLQTAIRKKIKILTTHALQEAIDVIEKSKYNFIINKFFVESLKNMDHLIALSSTDVRSLMNMGISKSKISLIPNGIDPNKFDKRNKFIEDNEKYKILCVARFDENKNYECLVYAINDLKNDIPNLEAYFIGAVSNSIYFEKITNLIRMKGLEKYIKIYVSLDDPSLIDCYLSCDLFVLPSKMETLPLVILEAMYAGLPVVATAVGGIPDIIKNGVNGFLVPPNDPKGLYERCLQLFKNDELRIKFGQRNKEIAKKYTWSKIASSTYKIYEYLLEKQ